MQQLILQNKTLFKSLVSDDMSLNDYSFHLYQTGRC